MFFRSSLLIKTPRLSLREFQRADWRRVFEYQSLPIYARFNSWDKRLERESQTFVARFIDWQKERPRTKYQFAIELDSEKKLIGNCGIRGTGEFIDAELGFELDPCYWHQGYATEASAALIDFAFREIKLEMVRAQCISENEASARVLKRIGMIHGRTEPNAIWMKERWWSTEHYSLSRPEWESMKSS